MVFVIYEFVGLEGKRERLVVETVKLLQLIWSFCLSGWAWAFKGLRMTRSDPIRNN